MKIYDISQEVLGCRVYPGDPKPRREVLSSIDAGAAYELSALYMCAHNGTHIDAPRHFIKGGRTVDEIPLDAFVGAAYVAEHTGIVTADDAAVIVARDDEAARRILLRGNVEVSLEAARVFAAAGLRLLGNEGQTVGPPESPMAVHLALLGADVVLLEGICLADIAEGVYLLNAAPLGYCRRRGLSMPRDIDGIIKILSKLLTKSKKSAKIRLHRILADLMIGGRRFGYEFG